MRFAGHRRAGGRLKAQIHQPVDGGGRVIDEQSQHDRIDLAVGDALRVAVVFVGTVLDALRFLQSGARRADLAGRPVQRTADAQVRLQLQHACASLCSADGERQTG